MYTNLYILSHFLEFSQPYIQIVIIISIGVISFYCPFRDLIPWKAESEKEPKKKWFLFATCIW